MTSQSRTTPFAELKERFSRAADLQVVHHCLGFNRLAFEHSNDQSISYARAIADQLAAHTVVLCFDTEHYTLNSDEMTEIGVTILHTQDVLPNARAGNYGDHGDNLMRQIKFHLLRLREKSHLPTTNTQSRGPAGNRFGYERFVTFEQARALLRQLLVQPITGINGLQGYNCPIVVLGHSIAHDRDHLYGKDLALNLDAIGTPIRYIDTQEIVRNNGNWWNNNEDISLGNLVQKLGFLHTDSHTACNDAARTMMCAILLALPQSAKTSCTRSTQQVASELETFSRANFVPLGGSTRYCCKCGSTQHMPELCQANTLQCHECVSRGLDHLATTHIALHCPVVRDEVAAERIEWYAGQPKDWNPKHPFSSRDRLQTFAPNAPQVAAATKEEMTARSWWYDRQRGSDEPLKPFVWYRRSFSHSPLRHAGLPRAIRRAPWIPPTGPESSRSNNNVPPRRGGINLMNVPSGPRGGNGNNLRGTSRGGGQSARSFPDGYENGQYGAPGRGRGHPRPAQRGRGVYGRGGYSGG